MENFELGTCKFCGVETKGISAGGWTFPAPRCCADKNCIAQNDAEHKRDEHERLIASVPALLVPPIYRDTETSRLPARCAEAAKNWEPSLGKGNLLIHGTTRTGKSRAAWYICKRLHPFPKVTHLSMRELEFHLAEGYKSGTWHRIVESWCRAPFLFIDDLGKEKTTEKIGSILFQIVDERTANKLPTIITTNHNGSALEARFTEPETGAAFVARLREFFDTVSANAG